jgi:hypothetical protein
MDETEMLSHMRFRTAYIRSLLILTAEAQDVIEMNGEVRDFWVLRAGL